VHGRAVVPEGEGVPSYQVEGRDGVIKVTNRCAAELATLVLIDLRLYHQYNIA
jgi:hypothetical protein